MRGLSDDRIGSIRKWSPNFTLSNFKIGLWPALLLVWLALPPAGAWAAFNQDILIFRPLHNSRRVATAADVLFEVEVSAFDPIVEVKINGRRQRFSPATWVALRTTVRLRPGENKFRVEAATKTEKAVREFRIRLEGLAKADEDKTRIFTMLTVLGTESAENVTKVRPSGTPISGTRTFLLAVPSWEWDISPGSALRIRSIISRDQWAAADPADDAELNAEEIAYTQIAFSYIRKLSEKDHWDIGLGTNVLYQTFDSVLQGATSLEQDSLLLANLHFGFGESHFYEFGLEVKGKAMEGEPADTAEDEDGTVISLKGVLDMGFGSFRTRIGAGVANFDAEGSNKVKTVSRFFVGAKYALGGFKFGLGAKTKQSDFPENANGPISETLVTTLVDLTYGFTKSLFFTLASKTEARSSNVVNDAGGDDRQYENTGTSAALIYNF